MAVLDISLPDFDGITLCRRLRATHHFPILMLTARTDAMDKVIGLEVGADDYLTKPFDAAELVARVRAHLRRLREYGRPATPAAASERTVFEGLVVDHDIRDAIVDGRPAHLTKREFELLAHLAANAGRVVTRDSLFAHNWGFEIEFSSNSLDVHIYRLRKKIEADPDHPRYIHTLRGYGYKLEPLVSSGS